MLAALSAMATRLFGLPDFAFQPPAQPLLAGSYFERRPEDLVNPPAEPEWHVRERRTKPVAKRCAPRYTPPAESWHKKRAPAPAPAPPPRAERRAHAELFTARWCDACSTGSLHTNAACAAGNAPCITCGLRSTAQVKSGNAAATVLFHCGACDHHWVKHFTHKFGPTKCGKCVRACNPVCQRIA